MKSPMTNQRLRQENQDYSGSGGVSAENRAAGFIPAFCDTATGQVVPSRLEDGRLAPMHLLAGLPREWALAIGDGDRILAVKESVIAGFIYAGIFYTRAQAARAVAAS